MLRRSPNPRRAFTFLEVMIVVIMIGILAAIVVPQFGAAKGEATRSALTSSLGGVRSAIAGYRANQALAGTGNFPTLSELTTPGTVLADDVPPNPYSGLAAVQSVTAGQAANRTVINSGAYGWNYFVNNAASPPVATFYANSAVSIGTDATGATLYANEQ
ncbi:MAG TPA: prepilin-type N-terminal cleavage/methylation domain-containing protein [Phycisphaerales bacterium]|nr:prepilin-type N-terminal cleavage/methylation domain-containing protein [Phycisphaerales bacterium]